MFPFGKKKSITGNKPIVSKDHAEKEMKKQMQHHEKIKA
jgi:lysophospholipid acyltransferase (LPLAT)-like uncharacterized protein